MKKTTNVHNGKVNLGRGEREREKSEELASLEASDDEGERRWPKRNMITR